MLKPLFPGDIVLTYFTRRMTSDPERASSIVGISKVGDKYRQERDAFLVDIVDSTDLAVPIRLSEMESLDRMSTYMYHALHCNLQRYIFEIMESDFIALMDIHEENRKIGERYLGKAEPAPIDESDSVE